MSHAPERKEKDCLNCGAIVQGRYCHVCGQENIVPKETFGSLVIHFFYDITHFDSKFFDTLKYLLFRPGFLSMEFIKGKRANYLNPVRMYVFTSAFFFLIFFSVINTKETFKWSVETTSPLSAGERLRYIEILEQEVTDDPQKTFLSKQVEMLKDTSRAVTLEDLLKLGNSNIFRGLSFSGKNYYSWDEYDSVQRSLPKKEKDGWLKRQWKKREIAANAAFIKNPEEALQKISDTFLHKLPYMLFVSLPLFALLLKLLYVRRKEFYYTDHGIFTIHLYIFTFLLLLMVFVFNAMQEVNGFDWVRFLKYLLFVILILYLYKGMRRFYNQRRFKTIIKFLLLSLFSLVLLLFLSIIFFFLSAFGM